MNRFRSVINEVESDQTDDDYLQKMNEDVRKKVIEYFTPFHLSNADYI
jgi:hypothetical protein